MIALRIDFTSHKLLCLYNLAKLYIVNFKLTTMHAKKTATIFILLIVCIIIIKQAIDVKCQFL